MATIDYDRHTATVVRNKIYNTLENDRKLRELWLNAKNEDESNLILMYITFVEIWDEAYNRGFDEGHAEALMKGC